MAHDDRGQHDAPALSPPASGADGDRRAARGRGSADPIRATTSTSRGRRAALLRALAELKPREREIVSLRYGSELNATEIAAQVGMEPANVRKILERVRARLGERIEALMKSRGVAA